MSAPDAPRLLAIDPVGCGCTECLTGEYRPLQDATDADIQALFNGDLRDNTSECWLIVQNTSWVDDGFTVYGGTGSFNITRIALPIPVENYRLEVYKEAVEKIYGLADHLGDEDPETP